MSKGADNTLGRKKSVIEMSREQSVEFNISELSGLQKLGEERALTTEEKARLEFLSESSARWGKHGTYTPRDIDEWVRQWEMARDNRSGSSETTFASPDPSPKLERSSSVSSQLAELNVMGGAGSESPTKKQKKQYTPEGETKNLNQHSTSGGRSL